MNLFIDGCANPTPISIRINSNEQLITSVYLDSHVILLGDNNGSISLFRRDGTFIANLNHVKPSNANHEDDQVLFSLRLNHRINCIHRSGRRVWVGYENSMAAVYDL